MIGKLAEAAVGYARRGWRVIPLHHVRQHGDPVVCACWKRDMCTAAGKHPTIKNWRVIATNDVELVTRWWRAWPLANVGILMGGAARLVAIDIDGSVGRESLAKIEETHGPLPVTLSQSTGREEGGEHRLFIVPDEFDMDRIRNRTKMALGIDVRAEGGLIVAPPSVHPSGAMYSWIDPTTPIALMPTWLMKLSTSSKARQVVVSPSGGRPPEAELERDGWPLSRRLVVARAKLIEKGEPAIQGQNGSVACLRAACLLVRGYCLPSNDAFDLLWNVYNPICVPAWSQEELMHKVDSAENNVSDEIYGWRFMIPAPDLSDGGRMVDALFREGNTVLDEAARMMNATPENNPNPTEGYVNKPKRSKRNTEGNVA